MNRKTYWDIYLIARNYKDNGLLKTNKVLKIFGYSKNTYIRNSKAYPFINIAKYLHPVHYWKIKNNYVAVLFNDLSEYDKQYMTNNYIFDPIKDLPYFTFLDPNNEIRYLINEEQIPFWKLSKYEGYIL